MIALIDGDVLAHYACAARFTAQERIGNYEEVTRLIAAKEEVRFTEEEDAIHMEACWRNFLGFLANTLEGCYSEEFMMAMKSSYNYRDLIYPLYKMNRHKDPSKMNAFVPAIRQRAILTGLAVEAIGREADDMLRIWSRECNVAGVPYTIATIDKDLDCLPGPHYHIKHKTLRNVEPQYALRFQYLQYLSGDPTDNIPGVPGVGPIKADAAIPIKATLEEMQEIVVEAYINAYDKDWYDMLLSNGKLLYLQGHEDDYFCCSHWEVVQDYLNIVRPRSFDPPVEEPEVSAVEVAPPPPVTRVLVNLAPPPALLIPKPSPAPKLDLTPPRTPAGPLPCAPTLPAVLPSVEEPKKFPVLKLMVNK